MHDLREHAAEPEAEEILVASLPKEGHEPSSDAPGTSPAVCPDGAAEGAFTTGVSIAGADGADEGALAAGVSVVGTDGAAEGARTEGGAVASRPQEEGLKYVKGFRRGRGTGVRDVGAYGLPSLGPLERGGHVLAEGGGGDTYFQKEAFCAGYPPAGPCEQGGHVREG
jgi:hypothetical protein